MHQIPTTAAHLALVASRTGKNLSLDEVGAVIDAINSLGAADDTLARTGNTEQEQAMWFAGMEQAQANVQDNAAIRAPSRDWEAIQVAIDEYLDGYELRADEGSHTPTDFERFLLDDCIAGLLAEDEILALLAAAPASPVSTVEQGETPYCYALETRGRHAGEDDVLLDVEYNGTDNFSGGRTGGIPLYRRPAPAAGDARTVLPPLNDDLADILGRPNFRCAHLAELLRADGHDIKHKSEHEQAAVIHFLLGHYLKHGSDWRETAGSALDAIAAQRQGDA